MSMTKENHLAQLEDTLRTEHAIDILWEYVDDNIPEHYTGFDDRDIRELVYKIRKALTGLEYVEYSKE